MNAQTPIPSEADVKRLPGLYAAIIPPIEEELADKAFLALAKLRDKLVIRNSNIAACRVDEAIEALEQACRVILGKDSRHADIIGLDDGLGEMG